MFRGGQGGVRTVCVALIMLVGCADEYGDVPDDVSIEITGSARADWRPDVVACMDPAWDWRISGSEPEHVVVSIPAGDYDKVRADGILTCLRQRPGVTGVNVPGYG